MFSASVFLTNDMKYFTFEGCNHSTTIEQKGMDNTPYDCGTDGRKPSPVFCAEGLCTRFCHTERNGHLPVQV